MISLQDLAQAMIYEQHKTLTQFTIFFAIEAKVVTIIYHHADKQLPTESTMRNCTN